MRAYEFITEGMSFSPTSQEDYTDPQGNTKKIWSGRKYWRQESVDCFVCDGTGIDKFHDRKCDYCHGTGKEEKNVSDAPELNVSNSNGFAIQRMLGLNPEYGGIILHADLPKFIRQLIKLKNTNTNDYVVEPSYTTGPMRKIGTDKNVTSIGSGPHMYDGGRSQDQINRYIDKLLEIFKFAHDNGDSVGWG
jgi:hypothetical protein